MVFRNPLSTNRHRRPLPTIGPVERAPWTPVSLSAISRLSSHIPPPEPCPDAVPAYRRAAVLMGLFQGRNGDIYIILSQRATGMRSHAGDTALPGGRFEANDPSLEATARREAWEECGLPIDTSRVQKLCELRSFLSANELVVTPVVVLITDPTIQPRLNPQEVSSVFSLPLACFLQHNPTPSMRAYLRLPPKPSNEDLARMPSTMASGISDWHTCRDALWLGRRYRRHTFWDTRNPVMGLTSDILIHAAMLAYDQEPDYVRLALGQPSTDELILSAFTGPLATRKRRVRPRFSMLPQPIDESETLGEGRDSNVDSRAVDASEDAVNESSLRDSKL
ncbi:hypothetical protein K437DRAFT_256069 [Tilletiaria anomala UBC 951]|uniref:Nudix hydrolase domain-containing protein n=1 Tax=Tilletiaria anomala (strain ATCC 24038 / CBS 436.72 / UBC 951) TaxID=1037660 RepID=A0A066W6U9_TILAU|nr:uncharacterized protein K437DRAFT_256069 [Tilletiaria anomala UBC 951]KDN46794.1 hypothetical protein K437DRAFT_256069 [Tilletiaria anomala UBC 951]